MYSLCSASLFSGMAQVTAMGTFAYWLLALHTYDSKETCLFLEHQYKRYQTSQTFHHLSTNRSRYC